MDWKNRDVISILDFNTEELEILFKTADTFLTTKFNDSLKGYIIANVFLEPSTRTRISFEVAAKRLGANVINFIGEYSSIKKGESIHDTIKMIDCYSDLIVIRSPVEGTAQYVAEISKHPVINAGDGILNHPTQAMIDLYTIRTLLGKLENLKVCIYGDLKYGRAAISFIYGISKYQGNKIYAVSPPELRLREEVKQNLINLNINFEELSDINEIINDVDIIYVTRIQKERFPDISEYEKVKGKYKIDSNVLKNAKDSLIVMHPLPRVDELSYDVDSTKHQAYFKQAELGIPLRMALLYLILK